MIEQPRTILIVEDDVAISDVVSWALEDEGYAVTTAGDGAAAINRVAVETPALIVLDMRMPVMDGAAFATAYHQMPGPHAPIIMLTASRDIHNTAATVHAAGVLAKPFDLHELVALVKLHLPQ